MIDGFSSDPDGFVTAAETVRFAEMGNFYPGVRAAVPPAYFASVGDLIGAALQKIFGYRSSLAVDRALYSLVTTPPDRLSLPQRIPHFDAVEDGKIAILHYLTHGDRGGTSFYRHRATGFETVDQSRHRRYLDALAADLARHGEPSPGYIDGDTALFERIGAFAPAYNRALIYRSSLLHCAALPADLALSANPRDGRLTVASFLSAS